MRIVNTVQMEKKLGPTDISKVSYGPKIAKIWSRAMPKFTFFGFLTLLRSFSVYPHNLEKDASIFFRPIATKIVKIHLGLRLVMSNIFLLKFHKIPQNFNSLTEVIILYLSYIKKWPILTFWPF